MTANTSTENETSTRHPRTPASGMLDTRLQACLSKRSHSTQSPINSPGKHSPAPKRRRRMRTGTEGKQFSTDRSNQLSPSTCISNTMGTVLQQPTLSIANFRLTEEESKSMLQLREMCNEYMLQKVASTTHTKTLIDFQTYFNLYNNQSPPECSNIIYYEVLSQRCDDKETLLNIISELYQEFVVTKKKKWIILEGDQATYERLQSIKSEYGNDLSWMIPFPGDWHFQKNFQEVLIKIYYDAGLSELATASGYQPNSIGSNFKCTHNFLLEVWESVYRHFLSLRNEAPAYIHEYVSNWIKSFPESKDQDSALRNLREMLKSLISMKTFKRILQHFFVRNLVRIGQNSFGVSSYFKIAMRLYMAIQSGNWDLRMGAIKSMAALFTAFDRPKYQKLIPQHIVDLLTISEVLSHLKKGGFTVSIRGRAGHSVGIDEAHEMCINKDCKEYITTGHRQ